MFSRYKFRSGGSGNYVKANSGNLFRDPTALASTVMSFDPILEARIRAYYVETYGRFLSLVPGK